MVLVDTKLSEASWHRAYATLILRKANRDHHCAGYLDHHVQFVLHNSTACDQDYVSIPQIEGLRLDEVRISALVF